MGACWRELSAQENVSLNVFVELRRSVVDVAFNAEEELRDLSAKVFREGGDWDLPQLRREVLEYSPDAIFLVGWRRRLPRWFATEPKFASIPKIMILDMPFQWSLRKILAPVILRGYLKKIAGVLVNGKSAARYARWLGFRDDEIWSGGIATDLRRFSEGVLQSEISGGFLFVGRYAKEKGLPVLMEAYRKYSANVERPWGLDCVGKGPFGPDGTPGVNDLGFVSPKDMGSVFSSHRVFVLPSLYEPWGVVLVEAAAAGLPIVCTEACGARHEVVRDNGIVVKTGDADSLASAMVKIHLMNENERQEMGDKGRLLVEPYSCNAWSQRIIKIVKSVTA